jgi:serine/threonine protein kinase
MVSLYSNNSIKRKKNQNKIIDSVPYRIEFIKNLLHEKSIKPLIDFDNTDTECFVNGHKNENESGDSYDTRTVLRKQFCDFTKVIMQIGNGMEDQLEYIKSGTSGHTFHGKIINDSGKMLEYGVKVVAYPRKEEYGDMYDVRRPENAELKMIKVLSYFVVKELTPHIVLPIGTFDTDIKTFVAPSLIRDVIGKKNAKYKEFLQKYENGDYYDKVSILMSEWANRGDLLDFFKKYHNSEAFKPRHWKSIFFQILSVLATIQEKYPGFRHNDLKANNILVHKIPMSRALIYRIGNNKYRIENMGYQIKLWDFDFACIPGVVDNKKVELRWTKKINATPAPNRYYDIHYFFNTLIRGGFCPEIMTSDQVPQEVKDFINRILPKKYQNDARASKLKKFIEEILPEKYKSQDIGSNFINNCYVPSNIKKFII